MLPGLLGQVGVGAVVERQSKMGCGLSVAGCGWDDAGACTCSRMGQSAT